MQVIVTGATGYLGLHIVAALAEAGHAVTALVRTPAKLGPLAGQANVAVCEATLSQDDRIQQAMRGHDACIHAAFIWGNLSDDLELRDTVASAKLFDAAARAGISRTLFVSSTAVHRPFRRRMSEDDRLVTGDVYGATKASNELFLWAACASRAMEGIVVRPGPIVGPPAFPGGAFRSPSRLTDFVERARRGEPIHVESGAGRQFVSASDVATVIMRLLTSNRANETYLCVAREITPWEAIARRIVSMVGSQSPIVVEPRSAGQPEPTFDVGKLEAHLGIVLESERAMEAHLMHLVRTG
ncbi:MAG TPA: NAD(P)-dependent oxidoreductase [Pirellulales bacterium]|nr:NAD(P)-dependent oxidoreductase [Pirellulales bacterium]